MGLLDKPQILDAMLTGKYAVETRSGRFVGAFDTKQEAMAAVLDDERASRHSIVDPILDPQKLDDFAERCRTVLKDDPRAQRALKVLEEHKNNSNA